MYSISSNSPLYQHEGLLKATRSISEATNQKWVDILTMIHNSGKTKISDVAYVLEMKEKQLENILSQMERERLVTTTNNSVEMTSKGRDWVKKENPMLESHRNDRVPMKTEKLAAKAIPKAYVKAMSRGYKEVVGEEMMKNEIVNAYRAVPKEKGVTTPKWWEIELDNKHAVYYVEKKSTNVVEVYDSSKMIGSIDVKKIRKEEVEAPKQTEEQETVTEAISTDQMMDYIENLLYAIMTSGQEKDAASMKDIERETQTRELNIPSKYVPAVLAKAEKIGFIEQDGQFYQMTRKAQNFIRKREA